MRPNLLGIYQSMSKISIAIFFHSQGISFMGLKELGLYISAETLNCLDLFLVEIRSEAAGRGRIILQVSLV